MSFARVCSLCLQITINIHVHEQALAKVDHAFGQLRRMKDGELKGINAEDLLNEL